MKTYKISYRDTRYLSASSNQQQSIETIRYINGTSIKSEDGNILIYDKRELVFGTNEWNYFEETKRKEYKNSKEIINVK